MNQSTSGIETPRHDHKSETKKLLEDSWMGGVVTPILITLIGIVIVWGITQFLSREHSHRSLIREMSSRTFGNRWVAAYELSKFISTSSIPEEDIPWAIESLASIMQQSTDIRTRKFIVSALGAMQNKQALPLIQSALDEPELHFDAVVALSRMPLPLEFDWKRLERLLASPDKGLIQVILLTLATHRVPSAKKYLLQFIGHSDPALRFSAATGLINYREKKALPVLKEILFLSSSGFVRQKSFSSGFNAEGVEQLKLNVLMAIVRNQWRALDSILREVLAQETNLRVIGKINEILNF